MRVAVINGPNLNLLGTREPEIYGSTTLAELDAKVVEWGEALGVEVTAFQSNHEGEIIDAIHSASSVDGIILNAGAYTHTSRAIADAIVGVGIPTVEVHISNVKAREPWRAESFIEDVAVRSIYGRGIRVYRDGLRHLVNRAQAPFETVEYGPEPDQVGELRIPGSSAALVVLVHGGMLLRHWERDTMETLALDLYRRGYASWNITYRRLGTGGGWPDSADDVTRALDHAHGLTDRPVVALGHSTGGFFLLAARPAHQPVRTVALSPITDLSEMVFNETMGHELGTLLMEAGAPSMINSVPAGATLIHGADDNVVAPHHTERLASSTEAVIVAGMGHFDMLDPGRGHWELVLQVMEDAAR